MSTNAERPISDVVPETYIVSGHPRSGTSMMMHALARGGLRAAYNIDLDALAANRNNYIQNPNGHFELSFEAQRDPQFPKAFWGRLIKSQYRQLVGLYPGRYKVLFMMRDPREIRDSYRSLGDASANMQLDWESLEEYYALMERFYGAAKQRRDMDVLKVSYRDVIQKPNLVFAAIRTFGFPIDANAAASVVDPALYRHREDDLSMGIPAAMH